VKRAFSTPVVVADAAAVTAVVVALESSLYGQSAFSQADLEDEWLELHLEGDARVVRDGDRIVGYGAVRERGELWRVEGYVHADALGRGIGKLLATGLEEHAARRGARRIQNAVAENRELWPGSIRRPTPRRDAASPGCTTFDCPPGRARVTR
jgi:GNAT superfamily N-acetyltransferase